MNTKICCGDEVAFLGGLARMRRRWRGVPALVALLTCFAAFCPTGAYAQSVNTLRIVVPFGPGSVTDLGARLIGDHLQGKYASTVIVENKAGASGRIGIAEVKNATPDGSTVVITPDSAMTIFPHVYDKLSYDPVQDFTLVAAVTTAQIAVLAGPAVPASIKTIKEYLAWVKADPAKNAFYATAAAGSAAHFTGVMLAQAAGIDFAPVHFKGASEAITATLSGEVPVTLTHAGNAIPHVQSGKARVLAITGKQRTSFLPEVPTMIESGFPDLIVEPWTGIFAPANTPPETLTALSKAVGEALKSPAVLSSIDPLGLEVAAPMSSDELKNKVKQDVEYWGPIVKATGFKAEGQ